MIRSDLKSFFSADPSAEKKLFFIQFFRNRDCLPDALYLLKNNFPYLQS